MKLGRLVGIATVAVVALGTAAPAGAVTITEFAANPNSRLSFPVNITSGPEGNLWWTDSGAEPGIARMSPSGEYFPRILDANEPVDIVVAPSGWASWTSQSGIGALSPYGVTRLEDFGVVHGGPIILTPDLQVRYGAKHFDGSAVVCAVPADNIFGKGEECDYDFPAQSRVTGLATTPAGVLWAALYEANRIKTYTSLLNFQRTIDLPSDSGPVGIAIGPEGSAWIAMWKANAIDRIDPDGIRARFPLPPGSKPEDIVLGPDGAFWITESGTGKIGRMTTAGTLTDEYPVPSGEPNQIGITVGPDQNIWFTDPEAGKVDRLVPDPPASPSPPSSSSAPSSSSPPPPRDTVAPRFLGSPSFSPSRFKVAGQGKARASGKRAAPAGTKVKFSLSEPARVTTRIAHGAPGRKAGRRCVAPGKAMPGAPKCTRYVNVGALVLNGKAGVNKAPFSGRLRGKALSPGRYRATLVARDAADNASQSRTTSFTIIP